MAPRDAGTPPTRTPGAPPFPPGADDASLVAAEEAFRRDGRNPRLVNALAMIHARRGDPARAARLFAKAVELDPAHVGYRNNLGNALRLSGDLERAAESYRAALALDAGNADSHFNLAVALTEAGKVDDAMAALEAALLADPRHPRAQVALGDLKQGRGDVDGAIDCYRRAFAVHPPFPGALVSMGTALHRKGQLRPALDALGAAVRLDPALVPAWSRLGAVLYDAGDLAGAIRCHGEALRLDAGDVDARINLAYLLGESGRTEEALAEYGRVLERQPGSVAGRAKMAELLAKRERWDEAIDRWREILEVEPGRADVRASLGVGLRSVGRLADALAELRRAVELDPRHVAASAHLGLALGEAGETEELRRVFDPDALVTRGVLGCPDGWSDGASFEEALADHVLRHPTLMRDRFGKPIHRGRQTHEIFEDDAPAIRALRALLDGAVREWIRDVAPRGRHPFFSAPPSGFRVSGWGVALEPGGFQDSHVHPESFVSGVVYLRVPERVRAGNEGEGCLSFAGLFPGEPDPDRRRLVRPEAGALVMFPSYYWHSTTPFAGESDRVCIAFNTVVP